MLIYEKTYLLLNFSVLNFLSLTAKHSLECRQGMMLLISSIIKVTISYWPHFISKDTASPVHWYRLQRLYVCQTHVWKCLEHWKADADDSCDFDQRIFSCILMTGCNLSSSLLNWFYAVEHGKAG